MGGMTAPDGLPQSTAAGADSFSEDLRALYGAVDDHDDAHQGMGTAWRKQYCTSVCIMWMLDKSQAGQPARCQPPPAQPKRGLHHTSPSLLCASRLHCTYKHCHSNCACVCCLSATRLAFGETSAVLVVAVPLTSEDDVARRLDRTLDTMARRTCVCVFLAVRCRPLCLACNGPASGESDRTPP